MSKNISLFIMLLAFWIILTERVTFESIGVGVFACIIVSILNKEYVKEEKIIIRKPFLYIKLLFMLIKEIIISNIEVAKIVLSPRLKIDPKIFVYKTKLKSEKLKVIFANTITITPGTITVSLEGNELIIHSLKELNKDGIVNSKIEEILLEIEGNKLWKNY